MAAMPFNVEKSAFRRGQYVAFDGRGCVWNVRKDGCGGWEAVPAPNNPAMFNDRRKRASTLTALAAQINAEI
jgi:hypothetical protein